MSNENTHRLNSDSILENITRTLLYEGYSLYPYHRSAIKNQKPVPFGVVFPQAYNAYNEHSHSTMRSESIVRGNKNFSINIIVRFLHLKKVEIFESIHDGKNETGFEQVYSLNTADKVFQGGWQTLERKINTGNLQIDSLLQSSKTIFLEFEKIHDSEDISDNRETIGKQINKVAEIKGTIIVEAVKVDRPGSYRLTVTVTNTTSIENAGAANRDDIISQSFLSTHIILKADGAKFISHQSPGEEWKTVISECENKNTWPILIEETDTTLLSSPIILYDYPEINPQSHGDLFDSTEIEEALLLHVSVLSDDEKRRIGNSDEKLQHMLNKVGQVTPQELINFHGVLKHNVENQIVTEKKSES